MVYFQTKNPNLGKFWRAFELKMLVYFMIFWNILRPFGIFYGHLKYFMAIWNILWSFGIFYGYFMAIWYNLWPFGTVCGSFLNIFFPFLYVWIKKNLQPWRKRRFFEHQTV
jgi:hypothetical protein